jgi:hypothetical protein
VALHNFCVLGKTEMLRFAFKMFDRDQSGEVTRDELRQMMIMVHGQNAKTDSQVVALHTPARTHGSACDALPGCADLDLIWEGQGDAVRAFALAGRCIAHPHTHTHGSACDALPGCRS